VSEREVEAFVVPMMALEPLAAESPWIDPREERAMNLEMKGRKP